jgi:hypothetical protein
MHIVKKLISSAALKQALCLFVSSPSLMAVGWQHYLAKSPDSSYRTFK